MSAFVCDAVRSPIGKYGGTLASIRPDDLAAQVIEAIVNRNPNLNPKLVDEVIFGSANQAGEDNRNVARMAALIAGLPVDIPGITVNRLCGSGMDAIGFASRGIRCGDYKLVIAGGVESMSRSPFVIPKMDMAYSRKMSIQDTTLGWRFVNPKIEQNFGIDPLSMTSDNVALKYKIDRVDQDAFALRSQQRYKIALDKGVFDEEIVPIKTSPENRSGEIIFKDEHPRPDSSEEKLAQLKPIHPTKGSVTAGNASGINDGASALLIASEEMLDMCGLRPMAKIVSMASAGVEPRLMGIGPIPATKKVLATTGLKLEQMDLIEINEAFASQVLATLRELGIPDDAQYVNPNGGAIAMGHPLGMSGARLILSASYQLKRSGGKYALCAMCVGVGQGVAVILEAC